MDSVSRLGPTRSALALLVCAFARLAASLTPNHSALPGHSGGRSSTLSSLLGAVYPDILGGAPSVLCTCLLKCTSRIFWGALSLSLSRLCLSLLSSQPGYSGRCSESQLPLASSVVSRAALWSKLPGYSGRCSHSRFLLRAHYPDILGGAFFSCIELNYA